jgi:hypothetical protein
MAKKKGNAGSKKKQRAAEAEAEVDENEAAAKEISPPAEEMAENEAPEVDGPVPKKRKPSRQKGDASPQAEVERQEHIKGAME